MLHSAQYNCWICQSGRLGNFIFIFYFLLLSSSKKYTLLKIVGTSFYHPCLKSWNEDTKRMFISFFFPFFKNHLSVNKVVTSKTHFYLIVHLSDFIKLSLNKPPRKKILYGKRNLEFVLKNGINTQLLFLDFFFLTVLKLVKMDFTNLKQSSLLPLFQLSRITVNRPSLMDQ